MESRQESQGVTDSPSVFRRKPSSPIAEVGASSAGLGEELADRVRLKGASAPLPSVFVAARERNKNATRLNFRVPSPRRLALVWTLKSSPIRARFLGSWQPETGMLSRPA